MQKANALPAAMKHLDTNLPSEHVLEAILDGSSVLWVIDPDGICRLAAGKALKSIGIDHDAFVHQSIFEVYAEYPDVIDAHRRALGGEKVEAQLRLGQIVLEAHCKPLRDENGEILGALSIATDHTECSRAEEQLQLRNRSFQALHTVDRATAELLSLPEALRMGLNAALSALEMDAGSIHLLTPDGESLKLSLQQGLTTQLAEAVETIPTGEGVTGLAVRDRLPVVGHADDNADPVSPTVRDAGFQTMASAPLIASDVVLGAITLATHTRRVFPVAERELLFSIGIQLGGAVHRAQLYELSRANERELEARVQERTRQLEEANRAKTQFLSFVSHELKTPLTSVIGFAELLKMNREENLTEKQVQRLEVVLRNATSLNTLISDLLDVSRIERGEIKLHRDRFDLCSLITELKESFGPILEGKRQSLSIQIPDCSLPVFGDRDRIRQVLSNLISNASKYSPDGTHVDVEAAAIHEGISISVRDHGIGISPEDQERLFEPFFRAENEATESVPGTGLGLVISKGVAEAHGGTLTLESVPGAGSTFTITLPVPPTSED